MVVDGEVSNRKFVLTQVPLISVGPIPTTGPILFEIFQRAMRIKAQIYLSSV